MKRANPFGWKTLTREAAVLALTLTLAAPTPRAQPTPPAYEFNDSHFHLTNYVQQGIDIHQFLHIMGGRVGRSALFGIPLQQEWSYANSGDFAPTYYLQTAARWSPGVIMPVRALPAWSS